MVELAEIVLPSPLRFEFVHFAKSDTGNWSGSETPENVIPNSSDVVDCSSTVITRSTRSDSEPATGSGTMLEKYCRLYRFLRPVMTFSRENTSPDSIGSSRDRKSTRLNSSHQIISYAVFC